MLVVKYAVRENLNNTFTGDGLHLHRLECKQL